MKLSLLIVEDDSEASAIISSVLRRKLPDASVYVAENGREGLELFKEHRPQIVITDIHMPEMNGFTMAREIRGIKADTKFVILTGYSDKAAEFGDIDLVEYIVKPINFKTLLSAVQACIEEIEMEREV